MEHLKHCLNPKVIAGGVVVAAAVWVVAPAAFAAALPLLILAICPLSMLAMVVMLRGSGQRAASGASASGHSEETQQPSQQVPAGEDSPDLETLRAQVAELERRLAAETQPAETSATEASMAEAEPSEAPTVEAPTGEAHRAGPRPGAATALQPEARKAAR